MAVVVGLGLLGYLLVTLVAMLVVYGLGIAKTDEQLLRYSLFWWLVLPAWLYKAFLRTLREVIEK